MKSSQPHLPSWEVVATIAPHAHRLLTEDARKMRALIVRDEHGTSWYDHQSSVSKFVRRAWRAEYGNDQIDNRAIRLIRNYLYDSDNVRIVARIDQYTFRLSVRMAYREHQPAYGAALNKLDSSSDWYQRTLRADETGELEHMAGSVSVRSLQHQCTQCGLFFEDAGTLSTHRLRNHRPKPATDEESDMPALPREDYRLSTAQFRILQTLAAHGGLIAHPQGTVRSLIVALDTRLKPMEESLTGTMATLDNAGLIERTVKGRRTYEVRLTERGREVVRNPSRYRMAVDIVADYLAEIGAVDKGNTYSAVKALADELDLEPSQVGSAIRRLEQDGLVQSQRPGGDKPRTHRSHITWLGDRHSTTPSPAPTQEVEAATSAPTPTPTTTAPTNEGQAPQAMLDQWSQTQLLDELNRRLQAADSYSALADEVMAVIGEVNNGTITPLAALGRIEQAAVAHSGSNRQAQVSVNDVSS